MNESNKIGKELELEYNKALLFTKSHYENFPVVSIFVPKYLRKHIAVIYKFARQADDIADEGNIKDEERLNNLNEYGDFLEQSLSEKYKDKFWHILKNTIDKKKLDPQNFKNLLIAFKQDLKKKEYEDYDELLKYCENSANPVGRIILGLYDIKNETAIQYSDNICTALQLTNFYQDVSIDSQKGRIYIPQEDLEKFRIDRSIFENKTITSNFKDLMKFEVDRTKQLFEIGRKLLFFLPTRLRFQILVTIKGGEAILKKIELSNYDVLSKRPKLTKFDFLKLFGSAFF